MSKKRSIPFRVGLLLMTVALSAVTFAVAAAMTEYAFIKPFIVDLVFTEPNLKIEEIAFNFDPENTTYPSVRVTVKNYGTQSASGTLHIHLFDSFETRIASGQASVNLSANDSVTATISLGWHQGKTAVNVASGKAVIEE